MTETLQCCVCRTTVGEFFFQATPGGEARCEDGTRVMGHIVEMVCRKHWLGPKSVFIRAGVRSPPDHEVLTITMVRGP